MGAAGGNAGEDDHAPEHGGRRRGQAVQPPEPARPPHGDAKGSVGDHGHGDDADAGDGQQPERPLGGSEQGPRHQVDDHDHDQDGDLGQARPHGGGQGRPDAQVGEHHPEEQDRDRDRGPDPAQPGERGAEQVDERAQPEHGEGGAGRVLTGPGPDRQHPAAPAQAPRRVGVVAPGVDDLGRELGGHDHPEPGDDPGDEDGQGRGAQREGGGAHQQDGHVPGPTKESRRSKE
jgi:hypothetical protein